MLADGVDEPADLGVGVLAEAGVDLHLTREELLLVGRQRGPVLDRLGLRRELRARRDDAQLDLPRERLLAHDVPALVELALVLGDPLLRHVVRRVRRARREVHEERLVGRERLLELHPGDRLVRHVGHEVVVRVPRNLDRVHAVVEVAAPTGSSRRRRTRRTRRSPTASASDRSGPEGLTSHGAVSWFLPKKPVL